MQVSGVFSRFNISYGRENSIQKDISELAEKTILPEGDINYTRFDNALVAKIVGEKEASIHYLSEYLKCARSEKEIVAALYVIDRMIDADVEGAKNLYPVISRYNKTNSPNIQVMLAGIYRKTLVPDAFGPLVRMMYHDVALKTTTASNFDPMEEVGGAVLEYLRNAGAKSAYEGVLSGKSLKPSLVGESSQTCV